MALINCNECGKGISDEAQACPNCGAPVITSVAPQCEPQFKYRGAVNLKDPIHLWTLGICALLTVLVGHAFFVKKFTGQALIAENGVVKKLDGIPILIMETTAIEKVKAEFGAAMDKADRSNFRLSKQVQIVNKEYEEASAEYEPKIEALLRQRDSLKQQIEGLNQQINALSGKQEELDTKMDSVGSVAKQKLDLAKQRLELDKDNLREQIEKKSKSIADTQKQIKQYRGILDDINLERQRLHLVKEGDHADVQNSAARGRIFSNNNWPKPLLKTVV